MTLGKFLKSVLSTPSEMLTALWLLVTIISVICAFCAYKHQKNRSKKESACNLAKYYADHIIPELSFISSVLSEANLEEKIKTVFPFDQLIEFDVDEATVLLKAASLSFEEMTKDMHFIDPKTILDVSIVYSNTIDERDHRIFSYCKLNKETNKTEIRNSVFLHKEYTERVNSFLNELEWFCMCCRYKIADEELLYQSLHKTFLSTVWLLYFYISKSNTSNDNKVYTNVIWLFNLWKCRLKKIQSKALRKQVNALKKIEKAELCAQKAKPKIHSGKSL